MLSCGIRHEGLAVRILRPLRTRGKVNCHVVKQTRLCVLRLSPVPAGMKLLPFFHHEKHALDQHLFAFVTAILGVLKVHRGHKVHQFPRYRVTGISLTEVLVVIALTGLLILQVIPPVSAWLERLSLTATTQKIVTMLRRAQQLSVSRQAAISVFMKPGNNWCLALSDGAGCDCASDTSCQVDGTHFRLRAASAYVALSSNRYSLQNPLIFNTLSGTSNTAAGSILLSSKQAAARVIISPLGRVRACAEAGALNGLPTC